VIRLFSVFVALLITGGPIHSQRESKSPPPQADERRAEPEKRQQDAGGPDYRRLRTYLHPVSSYCTSVRPDEQSEWRKKFMCESKITDAVLAILTFFLVIFTGLLVRVGARQDRTARQHLRAFVAVDRISILNVANPMPQDGKEIQPTGAELGYPKLGPLILMTIRNSGSTPAYDVIHWGNAIVAEHPLKSKLPERKIAKVGASFVTKTAMPPGGVTTKSLRMGAPLTIEEKDDLRAGTKVIYVYGFIAYRDAFRRKRRTNFRLMHGTMSGVIGIITDLTLAGEGNEAT
jgi:hypothetical protein